MVSREDWVVEVEDLHFAYETKEVLQGLCFRIRRGEIVALMGQSGSGKTTLMKNLVALLRPQRGKIRILGQDLLKMNEEELCEFRKHMGMLFQEGGLLNSLTLAENVALPLVETAQLEWELAQWIVRTKLDLVELLPFERFYPAQLSGGMKKRAGLARALALDPELLFLDEPTSGLDPITAERIHQLVLRLRKLLGTTILMVNHDVQSTRALADSVLLLHEGHIAYWGDAEGFFQSTDRVVRNFLERRLEARRDRPRSLWKRYFHPAESPVGEPRHG